MTPERLHTTTAHVQVAVSETSNASTIVCRQPSAARSEVTDLSAMGSG